MPARLLITTLTVVSAISQVALCLAQDSPPATPTEVSSGSQITKEQIESALAELEQRTELAADVKLQATENYRAAIRNLQSAADNQVRLKTYTAEAESAAARAQQLQEQRAALIDKKPSIETGLTIQALEQLLPATELALSGFRKTRQEAETDLQARSPRRKEIRARLLTIQEMIADASTQLTTLASVEPAPQNQSLKARLLTRKITLEIEKPALEAELSRFDAEEAADLLRLRMDVATSNAVYTEKLIALLQREINAAREAAAEEAVRTARREVINADPALKIYARQNQELAEQARQVAEVLAITESKLNDSTVAYDELVRQFVQTKKKVDSVGLSSSVGALLRKQKTTLPDVASRRAAVAERQQLINDIQYQIFEYEESHQELAEVDGLIARIMAEAGKDISRDGTLLESAAREVMKRQREYLDDLVRKNGKYFDTLIELDTIDQQFIVLESEYENYIDERVLWIRSGPALSAGINVEESGAWMLSPAKWKEAFKLLLSDAMRYPVLHLMVFAFIGTLLLRARRFRQQIAELGEIARKPTCRSIGPTLRGLWLSSMLSLGWPLVCIFVGWRLGQCAGTSEFTAGIGQGLKVVGILWGCGDLIRQLCRKNGIGEAHFQWPIQATSVFRREVGLCSTAALPVFFVAATLASSDGIHERGDIQRIAFIVGMSAIGFCFFRLLRSQGIFREFFTAHESGLLAKLKHLIPIIGTALPLSLAALAAAGYFYTAQTLFWRLLATFMFVATLFVTRSIFFRMLHLRRRYLSIEQSRKRAAEAQSAGDSGSDPALIAGIVKDDKQADISAQNLQSRKLVSAAMSAVALVGLWLIWIQVLPALRMIGNHTVFGDSGSVAIASDALPATNASSESGESTNDQSPSAALVTSNEKRSGSVTVSDLAVAVLIVVVTVVLFRNGPGLLEMSVLQQLPLEASVRYAITTLVSYVIVVLGVIGACSSIGLQWSQIQWLVTALTFGLAFGLQEIFANFVAGLIILLERPVRVGDVVTVDDVTGVVSRIRIRATSITNWDRKEYVVPNKEFITGRLLNWTLSDKVNRVVIEVGLAYGSDTERARDLLLEAANNHPVVLKDPAAIATFEGFGDNSLNLILRAYLPSLENRLQIIHEIYTAIDRSFRDANIEIAFPQRDLHIRSMSKQAALGFQADEEQTDSIGNLSDAA